MRALELAATLLGRAGEGPGLVAEQLALDELVRTAAQLTFSSGPSARFEAR